MSSLSHGTTSYHIISVHAQFPKNVVPNTPLDLDPANWQCNKCLAFPIRANSTTCDFRRSRTSGFTTLLESSLEPVEIFSESVTCPLAILFLLTTNLASLPPLTKRSAICFRLTPGLSTQGTVTSSRTSTRRDNFRGDVEDRGGRCVVTGVPPSVCNAAHLLPHSKGDTV